MAASRSKAAVTTEEPNRRTDIVHAAGRLFHEKGYSATTIRDIANAVGMGSGSPFYHFRTKHDMLRAVVLEGMDAISQEVEKAAKSGKSPRATFEAMLRAHLGQLLGEEGRDFAATLLHESRHLDPAELAELVALKDRYEAMWQKALKDLKRAGLIADDDRHLLRPRHPGKRQDSGDHGDGKASPPLHGSGHVTSSRESDHGQLTIRTT
jgi:AcrR family transcriptional regulator